ncbi:MAG: SRPBCC family protein [Rhizobiaceae bacterium]|nr:SRPBCC family protein [Rhizobiaceae bacterium]
MSKIRYALAGAALFVASPAFALDVDESADIKASPAKVWETIGDFCGIGNWHPAVEKCELGEDAGVATRTLTLAGGGGTLVEALVSRDEAGMTYTYKILSGPLPVDNYQSTITVKADGETSEVDWVGTFDAKGTSDAEAEKVITGIYESGLKAIGEKSAM